MQKKPFFLLLLLIAAPIYAQTRSGPFETNYALSYEGRGKWEPTTRPVREIEAIKSEPLFANLPFLRLRAGDELIRGETQWRSPKEGISRSIQGFFLKRGGQYQSVSVESRNGKLRLDDWSHLGFFEWETTRKNAEQLWTWGGTRAPSLTVEQLRRVETALLPDFAEHLGADWQRFTEFEEGQNTIYIAGKAQPKPVPLPGFIKILSGDADWPGQNFVFAGLVFDRDDATFYAFQMRYGSAGAALYKKPILVGPKPVWSAYIERFNGPNGPAISPAKGARLARFQAQKARHEKFLDIVAKVLDNKF